jgi:hypothetical protein
MATTLECANEVNSRIFVFEIGILVSAAFSVGVSVGAAHCFRSKLLNMDTRSRFYRITGILKLFLAAALFVLLPTCPMNCTCISFHTYYFYPIIAILIAIQWFSEATSSSRHDNEDIPFAVALPLEETEKDQELGSCGGTSEPPQTITRRTSTAVQGTMENEDYRDIPVCESILV